jgi:hypothetical protein
MFRFYQKKGGFMQDLTLAELRPLLIQARKRIGEMVKQMKTYICDHQAAKTIYERAFARAKVKEYARAKTTAGKSPTIINALAELDSDTIIAKDAYDLSKANLESFTVEFKAAEEDSISIKKAMSTIETEMRSFGA